MEKEKAAAKKYLWLKVTDEGDLIIRKKGKKRLITPSELRNYIDFHGRDVRPERIQRNAWVPIESKV